MSIPGYDAWLERPYRERVERDPADLEPGGINGPEPEEEDFDPADAAEREQQRAMDAAEQQWELSDDR